MASNPNLTFTIGEKDWIACIRDFTRSLCKDYWLKFSAVKKNETDDCEDRLNRQIPADFRLFWSVFGAGDFPDEFGGDIYTHPMLYEVVLVPCGWFWEARI